MALSGSVVQRINGERLAILGWGRAVLLQFAHPLVAAGVADYSGFRASPRHKIERFQRTRAAMLTFTFGTPEQAQQTARAIDAIHGRVSGQLHEQVGRFPSGHPYSARDPELLRWVHATLIDSTLLAYQTLVEPLSSAETDRYCAETRPTTALLGVPVEVLPATYAELHTYLEEMYRSGQIVVGPTARMLCRALFHGAPGLAGLVDLPLRVPYALVTAGLLPPVIRAAYGFNWSPAQQTAFDLGTAACRRIAPHLPARARQWPPCSPTP
ncbi:MAG: DUF2236 domain-containing protein [Chloroflexi bacterium]|nr:DUF2236 domain-containing protein [Chloroflexota bacterium]